MNTIKKYTIYLIISISLISLMLQSCVKDEFNFDKLSTNMDWDPNLAVALGYSKMTMRDVLRDFDSTELFTEDESGFLYIMYHKQVFTYRADQIISFPTQNYATSIVNTDINIPQFNSSGSYHVAQNILLDFAIATGEQLDSIILNNVTFNINLSSTFHHVGVFTITFPTIKKGALIYSKTFTTNSSGSYSSTNTYNDLTGYTIDLTNYGTTVNKLPAIIDFTITNSGAGVSAGDQIAIEISLENIDFASIYGDIGQKVLDLPLDTVVLDIYDNAFNGYIYLEDPKIRLKIKNSYGLPIQFGFSQMYSFSNINNTYLPIIGSGIPTATNQIVINAPNISQIGQSIQTNLLIDKTSSNIAAIIESSPKYVFFDAVASTNPIGTSGYNFITDSSKIDLDMEIELPLWGKASFFVLQDTIDCDIESNYEDITELDWLKLRMNTDNGFPTDVELQFYFTDSLYNVVDSVYTTDDQMRVIASGVLDSDGKVLRSTNKITDIIFTNPRINNLQHVRYVLVRGYIHTTNNATENVRFYSNYTLNVKVGAQAQFNTNTSDF